MLKGEKPSSDAAQLIDPRSHLHAEHGSNASSFAARVVIGTEANLHAAMTAAIAALSGPAHGGAAEDVMKMAEEIGGASAPPVTFAKSAGRARPSPGCSATVSTAPRIRARAICAPASSGCRRKWASRVGTRFCRRLCRQWRPTHHTASTSTSISIPASFITFSALRRDLFVPIFAIGRMPGWVVQVLEQLDNNILIRPLTLYSGPEARPYVPIEHRSG